MAAAVVSVPPLVRALGTDRFGVVSLFWLIAGYFSLFDLGLGRATTQLVAERVGRGETAGLGPVVWTAQLLMTVLGCVGGLALALIAPALAASVLKVPPGLQAETQTAFRVLALAIPAVTLSTGLRGILEAQRRFRDVNIVRCAMGLSTFVGPLALVPFRPNLVSVAAVLVATRFVTTLWLLPLCARALPGIRSSKLTRDGVSGLLRFGGWITVSNIVSPVMANVDRLFIGSLFTVSAVAYYATPFELVTKINILPLAFVSTLFPAFAGSVGRGVSDEAAALFERGMLYVLVAVFPAVLAVVIGARWGLDLWLGHEFADHGAQVARVLAVGVLFNGLTYVPSALVQAAGRPDLTAKVHLIEVPFYLGSLWLLSKPFGLVGVALAWALRVALDMALLCWCTHRVLGGRVRWAGLSALITACVAALALNVALGVGPRPAPVLVGVAVCAIVALAAGRQRAVASAPESCFEANLVPAPHTADPVERAS